MPLDHKWLQAFLLTEMIEIPIYCIALRKYRWTLRVFLAFGASLLTHPIVWSSINAFGQHHYWWIVTISELLAVIAEMLYLRVFGVPTALAWSLVANGSSYALGLTCQFLWGIP